MLEVITDFWKPAKKQNTGDKLDIAGLRVGSEIGFGFVPQSLLSGRRLKVSEINTYRFGDERLTSFILTQDGEDPVSMIIAEADGDKYLALSRRIPSNVRSKLFDPTELNSVMTKPEATRLVLKDAEPGWKQWVVSQYKREIQGLKGRLSKGDFRTLKMLPDNTPAEPFDYTLLVSDSNEYALEIEKYTDGRMEVYATIYRRLTDIGEITGPDQLTVVKPEPKITEPEFTEIPADQVPQSSVDKPTSKVEFATHPTLESTKPVEAPKQAAPESRDTKPLQQPKPAEAPEKKSEPAAPKAAETSKVAEAPVAKPVSPAPVAPISKPASSSVAPAPHGNVATVTSKVPLSTKNQEIKTVSDINGATLENENIECDLRIANKIIEEAIRNEMRLSDVVRRIIALPVAYPEAVQIPITLSDSDFQLLAIRFGMQASDRDAIKKRIIEELNDFSGKKN